MHGKTCAAFFLYNITEILTIYLICVNLDLGKLGVVHRFVTIRQNAVLHPEPQSHEKGNTMRTLVLLLTALAGFCLASGSAGAQQTNWPTSNGQPEPRQSGVLHPRTKRRVCVRLCALKPTSVYGGSRGVHSSHRVTL